MKVIDLLNKIANGEEVPKKIRIDHWCYKFEWKDYAGNYVDEHEDIDLMSALSCDREELNYEVHEIKEEKKIPEKLEKYYDENLEEYVVETYIKGVNYKEIFNSKYDEMIISKLNEIIDYLKSKGE